MNTETKQQQSTNDANKADKKADTDGGSGKTINHKYHFVANYVAQASGSCGGKSRP